MTTLLVYRFESLRRKFKNTPPGPWENFIPFVGYLPFLNATKPHQSLADLTQKYGKIYSLQMGKIFTVVLSDVALIREAFKRDEFSGRAPLSVTHGIFHGYGNLRFSSYSFYEDYIFLVCSKGIICTEGAFWKDQRGLVQKWLREMGMIKFGPKRELMQNRILEGIDLCIDELSKFSSQGINPTHILVNTVGNIVNDFIFGITYEWNDETWKHVQYLQEEGVKLVGVGAVANFLPLLR